MKRKRPGREFIRCVRYFLEEAVVGQILEKMPLSMSVV